MGRWSSPRSDQTSPALKGTDNSYFGIAEVGVFFCEAMHSIPKDLDELLDAGNCPLCEMSRLEEFAFVGSLTHQCYHEDRVIEDLLSRRFCSYHAWEAARIASHDTFALILEGLLKTEPLLQQGSTESILPGFSKMVEKRSSCLVCEFKQDREDFWAGRFVERIDDPAFRSSYRQSFGICFIHLAGIFEKLQSQENRRLILEHHIAKVKELAEEINRLRADGHFRGLGPRGEILARATRKLFGRRGNLSQGDQETTSRIAMEVERT